MERNISCDQLSTVEGRRFLAVPVRNKNEWRKRWRYGFLSFLLFSFCSLVWIPVSRGCSGPCASICGNFFIVQVITMKMAAAQRTHENGSQVASFEVKHTGTTVYIIMNNHTCIYIYICIICIYIKCPFCPIFTDKLRVWEIQFFYWMFRHFLDSMWTK